MKIAYILRKWNNSIISLNLIISLNELIKPNSSIQVLPQKKEISPKEPQSITQQQSTKFKMTSVVTDNKAKTPTKVLQYKTPKARGNSLFSQKRNMKLADWIVDTEHERLPQKSKDAVETKMCKRWYNRRKNYKEALINISKPENAFDIGILDQIEGFLSFQKTHRTCDWKDHVGAG